MLRLLLLQKEINNEIKWGFLSIIKKKINLKAFSQISFHIGVAMDCVSF